MSLQIFFAHMSFRFANIYTKFLLKCTFQKLVYNIGLLLAEWLKFGYTFLPHMAKEIRPPSTSPAGMLLMALMRSPAHAHNTSGFIDNGVPSFSASPRSSLAMSKIIKKV